MDTDDRCAIHGYEPLPSEFFRVCQECGHVYVTAQELLDATRAMDSSCGIPVEQQPTTVEAIYSCPLCTHDF